MANGNSLSARLKKVRGAGHDPFEKCEIATIGGGADLRINMVEPKTSEICREELDTHQRGKRPKSGTPARFNV
jgi:hypothetical protein